MSKTTKLHKKSLFWAHRSLVAQHGGLGVVLADKDEPTPSDLEHWQRECALFAKTFSDWHRTVCDLLGVSPFGTPGAPQTGPQPVDLDEADDGPELVDAS